MKGRGDGANWFCGTTSFEGVAGRGEAPQRLRDEYARLETMTPEERGRMSEGITEEALARYPGLWRDLRFPRIQQPNGYRALRHVENQAAMNLLDLIARLDIGGADYARNTVAAIVYGTTALMQRSRWPVYYVARDMAAACSVTNLPEWLTFEEMRWPLPSMIFMLPEGLIRTNDGEVISIGLARVGPDEDMNLRMASVEGTLAAEIIPPMHSRPDCSAMGVWAVIREDGGTLINWALERPLRGPVTDVLAMDDLPDIGDAQTSEETMALLPRLGLNLLLAMQARPELIEGGGWHRSPTRKERQRGLGDVYAPRWLGKYYRHASVRQTASEGTGISPRMHWRRGHWRNVACGAKWAEHRLKWIEPVLVNATEVEK